MSYLKKLRDWEASQKAALLTEVKTMDLPTFKIRNSDGEPSNHEAVHVVYVRELWAEKERLRKALEDIRDIVSSLAALTETNSH